MPFTPAHAAAVLPLRRWLPLTALVAGAIAPDLAYLFNQSGVASHSLAGLVTWCVPAGWIWLLWSELLMLPLLERTLPRTPSNVAGLAVTRGLPRSLSGILLFTLSIVLGAATHDLWDGFTHTREWPASVLYPSATLTIAGVRLTVARWLQYTSSIVGCALVLAFAWAQLPSVPTARGDHERGFLLGATLVVASCAAGFGWRRLHPLFSDPIDVSGSEIWAGAAAGWVMLTLWSLASAARLYAARRSRMLSAIKPERNP